MAARFNKHRIYFFSGKNVIGGAEIIGVKLSDHPMILWLTAGVLPFFLIVGHYLLYSNTIGGIEKTHDIMAMKSTLLGFFIWLLVTVITSLFNINISYSINIGGGYLTMLIVFLLTKM